MNKIEIAYERGSHIKGFGRPSKKIQSIIDIIIDGKFAIAVFPGNYGKRKDSDIIVTYYYDRTNKLRTIKHSQWVADLLMKLQGDKRLTIEYINNLHKIWESAKLISNRKFETLKSLIECGIKDIKLSDYSKLNKYGVYDIKMLFVIMLLLSYEEKNNNKDARYLGEILEEMVKEKPDLYTIVYKAGA